MTHFGKVKRSLISRLLHTSVTDCMCLIQLSTSTSWNAKPANSNQGNVQDQSFQRSPHSPVSSWQLDLMVTRLCMYSSPVVPTQRLLASSQRVGEVFQKQHTTPGQMQLL